MAIKLIKKAVPHTQALLSAFLMPACVCGTAFFINFIAIYYHASRAIPFGTMEKISINYKKSILCNKSQQIQLHLYTINSLNHTSLKIGNADDISKEKTLSPFFLTSE
jgi:hypothetical protein